MHMHKYYAAVLALATAMVDGKPTHPQRDSLPKCAEAPADCKCPAGTELQYSTTYALIGAAAKDVKAITGSFFDTAWFGETPGKTSGRDNTPGAVRTFTGPTDVGTYTFDEKIVKYSEKRDGSFSVLFEQGNGPIPYTNGKGSFSGYWDTLTVRSYAKTETILYWDIYACWTGKVADFAKFHESAINKVTDMLKSQGKLTGHCEKPVSF